MSRRFGEYGDDVTRKGLERRRTEDDDNNIGGSNNRCTNERGRISQYCGASFSSLRRSSSTEGVAVKFTINAGNSELPADIMPMNASNNGEEFSESFQSFCKYFVPCISLTACAIILVIVIYTSGAGSANSSPKVALVVFEGLKGTVFHKVVFESNFANHMKQLCLRGACSQCSSINDATCARTQSGSNVGPQYTFQSGPGIASILTGVNVERHGVYNNSYEAYSQFTQTSKQFPSIAQTMTNAGKKVLTVGTSTMLTVLSAQEGTCTNIGVLDFECGNDMSQRCLRSIGCNTQRVLTLVSNEPGVEETSVVEELSAALESGSPDLLILHTNKLARNAQDPQQPSFNYSTESLEYVAELYQLDAVIGQLVAILKRRTSPLKENWLVIITSAHGGLGKTAGRNKDDDEVIPFLISTVTTSSSTLFLKPLNLPASQMDVVPTILRWMDLSSASQVVYDGEVQSICSSGNMLRNCSVH